MKIRQSNSGKQFAQKAAWVVLALAVTMAPSGRTAESRSNTGDGPQVIWKFVPASGSIDLERQQRVIQKLEYLFSSQVYPLISVEVMERFKKRPLQIEFGNTQGVAGRFIVGHTDLPESLNIEIDLRLAEAPEVFPLLVHEMFHAIHYLVHPDEPAWVREGLAQNFEYLVTGHLNGVNASTALVSLSTSLVAESQLDSVDPALFGHYAWYFYYLLQNCAGDTLAAKRDMFWKLAIGAPSQSGIESIETILNALNTSNPRCKGFRQSVVNFEVARAHNRGLPGDPGYHLVSTTLRPNVETVQSPERIESLREYEPLLMRSKNFIELKQLNWSRFYVYWLENKPPFRVLSQSPTGKFSNLDWNVLVIR